MVQYLSSGMYFKSFREKFGNMFGNVIDIFMKYSLESLFERELSNDNIILYFCVKWCCEDLFFRKYLEVFLVKIKESEKFLFEKEEEILLVVNKEGDIFFYFMVLDEMFIDILIYFFVNFSEFGEKIFKVRNSFGEIFWQIVVQKRFIKMFKVFGVLDVVINILKKVVFSKLKNFFVVVKVF